MMLLKRLPNKLHSSVLSPALAGTSNSNGNNQFKILNKMKQIFLYIVVFSSLAACTKQIDINLKNAEPQLTIEANVTNVSSAEVRISRSVSFSTSNNFPVVAGAIVTIKDDMGARYNLLESTPGKYTNDLLIGSPGHTYTLSINVEGKTFTANSTMPLLVKMDTLIAEKINLGNEFLTVMRPRYIDPAPLGNCYRFIETINGTRYPQAWVWDDGLVNNGVNSFPLIQDDSTIKTNDIVTVEMQNIDKNVYRYFTALLSVQQNATTPANPPTNISGGALGYFSAHTSQERTVRVQ
jgi:hypothetical protein